MLELRTKPGEKLLELGGGDNPHPACECNVDVRPGPKVHFSCDFNGPLPMQDSEWDGVLCQYALEHVSFRAIPGFLKEVLRILKPGGKAVFVVPNTEQQLQWIIKNPDGWDGKKTFEAASELLYGSQDYPENSHKAWLCPDTATDLFRGAGFNSVNVQPFNERGTDMIVEAVKKPENGPPGPGLPGIPLHPVMVGNPDAPKPLGIIHAKEMAWTETPGKQIVAPPDKAAFDATMKDIKRREDAALTSLVPREQLFGKDYFNGGKKFGGYAREGYWDYPVHHVTFDHVMARRPESVLEIGCARGYIVKRLQDAGIQAGGLEISKHCYLTRVAHEINLLDLCKTPWPIVDHESLKFDLCFSIATLEHVPEEFLPAVIGEMKRTCKRGLHGVDFGGKDDGFDKTHCTLRPRDWWIAKFTEHAPGWPVEVVDKEDLERGEIRADILRGDGKVKLNVGSSYGGMCHHGWLNVDLPPEWQGFAQQHRYNYLARDVRNGLPFNTSGVDLIVASHFLEHLTFDEGLRFLRECRRVLKPEGAMRIAVPDTRLLTCLYNGDPIGMSTLNGLEDFDEISDTAAAQKSAAGKLHALLQGGDHKAFYDSENLQEILKQAGFTPCVTKFRSSGTDFTDPGQSRNMAQILKETNDMFPCLSLYVDAAPATC